MNLGAEQLKGAVQMTLCSAEATTLGFRLPNPRMKISKEAWLIAAKD